MEATSQLFQATIVGIDTTKMEYLIIYPL